MHDPELILQQYLHECEHLQGLTDATLKHSKNTIRAFQCHADLEAIEHATTEHVRNYILYGRSQCSWTPSTTRTYWAKLKVYFNWCIKRGYAKENPTIDIELPRKEFQLPKALTEQQAHHLLETVYNYPYRNDFLRYRNHAVFSTYLFTGLRKKELLNLRFTDVDFDAMSIFVRQGKGRKDRTIPMNFSLAESLKRYLAERTKARRTAPGFFASSKRNSAMSEEALIYLVKQIRAASGIYFTVHQLRHTFATLMVEGGCDVLPISKMLGHSKIETTLIYAHARSNYLREEMGKHPLEGKML